MTEYKMPVKVTEHYKRLAAKSPALTRLISPPEILDHSGEEDVGNQNVFSPSEYRGTIIHKYPEIVLAHVAGTCSAHCTYCYKADLFNKSTGKGIISVEDLSDYLQKHPEVDELLLSGGDPMVLSDVKLFRYIKAAAAAGIRTIRIGTKELAFNPIRFHDEFFAELDMFHVKYPTINLVFVTHFTHPDEWTLLAYVAIMRLLKRGFVSLENQFPIIKDINDNSDTLHALHRQCRLNGIRNLYTFQCRNIVGYKSFAIPVEEAWRIHNKSQMGLTSLARSKFVMSTTMGKLEVIGLTRTEIMFKLIRSRLAELEGGLMVAPLNPQAMWIDDYELSPA